MSKMPWWEKIQQLQAELAEARAEIAHLDKVLRQVGRTGMDPTKADELERARAQIAAKDAALREGSSQWLLDAVANWKKRAEVAEALVTEAEHMRESLAWYAKREADLLARAEKAEAQIAAKDAELDEARWLSAEKNMQIAAKDAALRECRVYADQANMKPTDLWARLMETIDAALAATARETE